MSNKIWANVTKMCIKTFQLLVNHYLCSIYIFMAKNLLLLQLKIGGKTRLSQGPSALVLQVLRPDICRSQAAYRRNGEHPLLEGQSHRRGFGHGVRSVHEDSLPQAVEDLQGFSSNMLRASHSGSDGHNLLGTQLRRGDHEGLAKRRGALVQVH